MAVQQATPRNPDEALRTGNLSQVVQGKPIVDSISVSVRRGDMLAVVGSSRSRKSSFLRLLNRLDEPTGGTVFLGGTDYREIAPRELRRRVGMVTQSAFLFPGMVADNLRFGPQGTGRKPPARAHRNPIEPGRLVGLRWAQGDHLSGGGAQRVSLARTLANRPEILLWTNPPWRCTIRQGTMSRRSSAELSGSSLLYTSPNPEIYFPGERRNDCLDPSKKRPTSSERWETMNPVGSTPQRGSNP